MAAIGNMRLKITFMVHLIAARNGQFCGGGISIFKLMENTNDEHIVVFHIFTQCTVTKAVSKGFKITTCPGN